MNSVGHSRVTVALVLYLKHSGYAHSYNGMASEVPDTLTSTAEIALHCTHADRHTINGLNTAT